jgi:CPA1 family monovalent cation:H+ antiporter
VGPAALADPRDRPGRDGCGHLEDAPDLQAPAAPRCLDCVREGTTPVHLRMCLECGEVGCCESSPGLHADRHFRNTGHPLMRSVEPGESWRWCYLDEVLG